MAFCDYHACDNCGSRKTFYDSDLPCEDHPDGHYTYSGYRAFALCRECEETHEIIIRPKALKEQS